MRLRWARRSGAVLLALWFVGGASGQDRSTPLPYAIPGHGALRLNVPAGWRVASKALQQPPSLNLRFTPSSGDAFSLQVTAVWLDSDKIANAAPDRLKASTTRSAEGPLQQAVEKTAVVQELRGAETVGYYFSLTDRAPKPGEYTYLTQGNTLTGEVMVVFTFLHRGTPSADKDAALSMLADATHSR